jgi:HK97 family phage major capsid protein
MFPASKALHSTLETRCKKDLTAGVPSDGGFTIPIAFSPDYIKALYANTILEKLGVRRVPMPNGNFSIPKMDGTSAVSWLGEAQALSKTAPSFGEVNLKAKKLGALCAISNTLLRNSGVGIDSWVSDDLMEKARIALDYAALYGAGTEYTPKGLANQTGIQTVGSSATALGLTTPVDEVALLEQANVPMSNVKWLFSPIGKSWILSKAFSSGPWAWADEMLRNKTLNGYPFITSSTVGYTAAVGETAAYGDFWIGDFSQFIWGVAYDLSIEMTREGSYVSGGQTVSAFQNDLTLIRLISEHDFAVRQPKAFVHGIYSKS